MLKLPDGEVIPRRSDKEDFRAFAIIGYRCSDTGNALVFFGQKVDHVFKGLGSGADMAASLVTTGHRRHRPINIKTHGLSSSRPRMVISAISMP